MTCDPRRTLQSRAGARLQEMAPGVEFRKTGQTLGPAPCGAGLAVRALREELPVTPREEAHPPAGGKGHAPGSVARKTAMRRREDVKSTSGVGMHVHRPERP